MIAPLFIIPFLLSLSLNTAAQSGPSLEAAIKAKQWQRRVVLVYARALTSADLAAQKQLLAAQRDGLHEREIDLMVVLETELSAADRQYLRSGDRKLAPSADFITYLIGKDGGVKQRYSRPVAATELFRIIDSMPMRQQETRRKGQP